MKKKYIASIVVVLIIIVTVAYFIGVFSQTDLPNPESTPLKAVITSITAVPHHVGNSIEFSAKSSTSDSTITDYEWDFEGEKKTGIIVEHVFQKEGKHMVSLTIKDSNNNNNKDETFVNVTERLLIPSPDIDLTTKLSGIAYSPYRTGQSPITGPHPNIEEIEDDIRFLSSITDRIRTYGLDGNNQFVPEIAQKYGVKIAVTLLLTGDETTDQVRIERGINIANKYPDTIYTLIVENESLYRETMNEDQIISYLIQIKEKLNSECTITIAEPSFIWLQHSKIVPHVDYVMIHYYPYWSGFAIDEAARKVFDAYYETRDTFGKDIVIGETGWPSSGRDVNLAMSSQDNQYKFIKEFREIADLRKIDYFYFEAFDEEWKLEEQFDVGGPNNVENHWGLFYANGTLKESLKSVIPTSSYNTSRK